MLVFSPHVTTTNDSRLIFLSGFPGIESGPGSRPMLKWAETSAPCACPQASLSSSNSGGRTKIAYHLLDEQPWGEKPLQTKPELIQWFQMFHADNVWGVLKCVLVGTIVTGIIQSSPAATAISISLTYNREPDLQSAKFVCYR